MPFQSCSIDKPLASFSYWLSLSLHLCLGAFFFFSSFFFHRSPHCCKGHECKCCGEGFEPHFGDEVWAPSGTLKPRWKGDGNRGAKNISLQWRSGEKRGDRLRMKARLNGSGTVLEKWEIFQKDFVAKISFYLPL